MAKFGGWSKFGGGSRFGGRDSWWHTAYRLLKGIMPPGLWPSDDDLLINLVLRAEAQLVAHGHIFDERLEAEMFPQGADEALPAWERFLNVVPRAGSTIAQRREAVVARWRGGKGSSLPELRRMLYPLLNPSTAWLDDFADASLSYRWTASGNGTRSETGSVIVLQTTSAVNCELDGVTDNGNVLRRRVHDPDDDFTATILVDAYTTAAGCGLGLAVWMDFDNFVMLALGDNSGSILRVDTVLEGVLAEDVGSVATAAPSAPLYMQIEKVAGELVFRYGADESALTELHRIDLPKNLVTREVALFARNTDPSLNASEIQIDQAKLAHATGYNNVEIIERSAAALDLRGESYEGLMIAFVHRRPTDPGEYNLEEAARLADKARQAHTLLLVGESDVFLCDDEFSLCNRDILGS